MVIHNLNFLLSKHNMVSPAISSLRSPWKTEAFQGDPYRPCLVLRPEGARRVDRLAGRNTLTKVCWNTPVRWGIRLLPTYLADAWPARMLAAASELQGSKGKHSMKHA